MASTTVPKPAKGTTAAKKPAAPPPVVLDETLSSSLKTGRSLFLLKVLTRLVTFGLNQALVRIASPEVFGTAAIQFDLITSTILFLSREGIRNALLRKSYDASKAAVENEKTAAKSTDVKDQKDRHEQSMRLASVPFFLALPILSALVAVYFYISETSTTSQRDFHLSLGLYILASMLELAIEPMYIRTLTSSPPRMNIRLSAEGGMAVVKAVVTFGILVLFPEHALLGFALGQIAGSGWLVGRYVQAYDVSGLAWSSLSRKGSSTTPPFDPSTQALAVANTRQSFIKHFLTELDRIAVTRLCSLQDQGGYAIAMNYGSLVARLVFQPIEETLLLHFSANPPSTNPHSGELMMFIAHIASHILFICPAFVPPLYPPSIVLLLPKHYLKTSAPFILRRYLEWYVPLLGLNGVLEAFVTATSTPKEVSLQASWMFVSSAAFVGVLYAANKTQLGINLAKRLSVGPMGGMEQIIIAASCLSMVIRIGYALWHARKKIPNFNVLELIPRTLTSASIVASGVVLRKAFEMRDWRINLEAKIRMITLGALCFGFVLTVLVHQERATFEKIARGLKTKTE